MARKQSSKIYFDGKYHKEIVFDGHYHDKMYLCDGSGNLSLVWQKLGNGYFLRIINSQTGYIHNGKLYYVGLVHNEHSQYIEKILVEYDTQEHIFKKVINTNGLDYLWGIYENQYYFSSYDSNDTVMIYDGSKWFYPGNGDILNGFVSYSGRVQYNNYRYEMSVRSENLPYEGKTIYREYLLRHHRNSTVIDEILVRTVESPLRTGASTSRFFMVGNDMAKVFGYTLDGNNWNYVIEKYSEDGSHVGDIPFALNGRYQFSQIATMDNDNYFVAYKSTDAIVLKFDGVSCVGVATINAESYLSVSGIKITNQSVVVCVSDNGRKLFIVPINGGEITVIKNTLLNNNILSATENEENFMFFVQDSRQNQPRAVKYIKSTGECEDLGLYGVDFVE